MQLIVTLCCLVAIKVGSVAFATSVPPNATVENMSVAWRAVGPSGDHYRLVLDASGRGQLGIAISGTELLFEVESVAYDGNRVSIRLAKHGWKLTGEGYPGWFLELAGTKVWGDEILRFYPESQWSDKEQRLAKVMRPPRE